MPFEHRCPEPQADPAPHRHCPPLQLSAFAPHEKQACPAVPHCDVLVPVAQLVPLQHPLHDEVSQTQLPAEQRCPGLHALPVPQRQTPLVHRSARNVSHALHSAPFVPQAVSDGVWHTPPEQHPLGHVVELQPWHAWFVQVCPIGHVWHVTPPEPQAACCVPG